MKIVFCFNSNFFFFTNKFSIALGWHIHSNPLKPLPRSVQDSDTADSVPIRVKKELSSYPLQRDIGENVQLHMFTLEDAMDRIPENKMTDNYAHKSADHHVENHAGKRIDRPGYKRFETKISAKPKPNMNRRIGPQDKVWTLIGPRGEMFRFNKLKDLLNSPNLRRTMEYSK